MALMAHGLPIQEWWNCVESSELVSASYVKQLADEEVAKLPQSTDYTQAQKMFIETSVNDDYLEFLTLPAYEAMA